MGHGDSRFFVAAGDELGILVSPVIDHRFVQTAETRTRIGRHVLDAQRLDHIHHEVGPGAVLGQDIQHGRRPGFKFFRHGLRGPCAGNLSLLCVCNRWDRRERGPRLPPPLSETCGDRSHLFCIFASWFPLLSPGDFIHLLNFFRQYRHLMPVPYECQACSDFDGASLGTSNRARASAAPGNHALPCNWCA